MCTRTLITKSAPGFARVHPPLPPAHPAPPQALRALPAGRRLGADPIPGVPRIFTGLPAPGVRGHFDPGPQEARKRIGAHGLFVVCDVANLPFRPDVFDGVVSLHHPPLA